MAKTRKLLLTALLAVVCLVASLCAVLLPTATPAQAAAKYEYVCDADNNKFVVSETPIMIVHQINGIYYAMTNDNGTLTTTQVTLMSSGAIDESSVTDSMLWIVSSGLRISSVADNKQLKGAASSGNAVTLETTGADFDASANKLSMDNERTWDTYYLGGNASSYSMQMLYNTNSWAKEFSIFRKQEAQVTQPEFAYVCDADNNKFVVSETPIMIVHQLSGEYYAMTNENGTLKTTKVTLTLDGYIAEESVTDSMLWIVSSGLRISSVADNKQLKGAASSGNAVTLETTGADFDASANKLSMDNERTWDTYYLGGNVSGYSMQMLYNTDSWAKEFSIFRRESTSVEEETYTVTFVSGNESASGSMSEVKVAQSSSTYTLPNCAFTVVDYNFAGWKIGTGDEVKSAGETITLTSDITLTATWTFTGRTIYLYVDGEINQTLQVPTSQTSINVKNTATTPVKEGYTFVGWFRENGNEVTSLSGTSIVDGLKLYAKLYKQVTLQFKQEGDSEPYDTLNATSDSWYVSGRQGTVPEGKQFAYFVASVADSTGKTEFKSGNRYYINQDADAPAIIIMTPVYAKQVTLSFDLNGGIGNISAKTGIENSTLSTPYASSNPTREGWTFEGWSIDGKKTSSGEGKHLYGANESYQMSSEDVVLKAVWSKDMYTITLSVNGSDTTKTVNNGDSFTPSELFGNDKPFKRDMVFVGWLDADNQLVDETTPIIADDDMTFTASFREPETYTFTFHWGELTATKDYTEGAFTSIGAGLFSELFADEIGERDVQCTGWYEEAELINAFSVQGFTVGKEHENKHLYAAVSEKYEIVFNWSYIVDGEENANTTSRKAALGTPIAVPYASEDVVTRVNYRLMGWAETPDGEIKLKAEQGVTVSEACTLYAVWDYNYYVVTIKLFGSDEAVGTVEVAKNRSGNTLVKINELKDSNDILVINWTEINVEGKDATWTVIKGEDEGRDTAVNEQITLTSDITLQVRFSDHLYTITVNWVGGKLAEIKQAYNTDVTAPETDKAGYTFVAFYLNDEQGGEYTFDKMPSQDIVVWAKYEILDSTLKFDTGDGSEIADITQKTGTQVDKPADPTREGYLFVKWQIEGSDVVWLVKEGTGATTNPEYYINMPGGTTTMVAKWELTAEGLAAIKAAKLAALDAYVTEKDVDLPESYSTAINNATTEAGVNEAYEAAIAKVDELKAEKDAAEAAAAQALADAKTAAKAEVAAKAAEDGVSAPSTEAIDAATSIEAVNTAKAAALAAIAQAKADKEAAEAAQALADAKTAAKAEVAAKAKEDGVSEPSTEAIDAATSIEAVNTAKAAALAAIAQAKADKEAAEAAAAESKAKVDAAKAKVAALSGKNGAELYEAIKAVDAALAALSADEKAQVDLTAYNQAKSDYSSLVAGVQADLTVAEKAGASIAAISLAGGVAALAALAYVLKRRMF